MALDRLIRSIVRSTPALRSAAFASACLLGALVFIIRSGANPSSDGQSIDMAIAYMLLTVMSYFIIRAAWTAVRLWAESRPPALPTNEHPFGRQGIEDPEEAARRMRGGKL